MAKTLPKFTPQDYYHMISESNDIRTISAVLVLAMSGLKKKEINNLTFANILADASDAINERML